MGFAMNDVVFASFQAKSNAPTPQTPKNDTKAKVISQKAKPHAVQRAAPFEKREFLFDCAVLGR